MIDVITYLKLMADRRASDLFLTTGAPPSIKVDGLLHILNAPKLVVGEVEAIANGLMSEAQRRQFESSKECNFSWSRKDAGRYRINVYYQRGEVAMVLRMINSQIPSFEALGLPPTVAELALLKRGLVLVVGAAGCGKSTTLASMIKYRSLNAAGHILTIEDPIEYLFSHAKSIVDQREVGIDTLTFGEALHNALREAPDVIMLGEIRDRETAQHALSFADTGHLCLSTLHANNASQAVERLLNFFPEDAQKLVLQDLSHNLKAVVSQRLIPALDHTRALAVEILLQTPLISDLIARGLINQIQDELGKGHEQGMVALDDSLFALYHAGRISAEQAIANAESGANMSVKIRLSVRHTTADAPGLTMEPKWTEKF